MRVVALVPDLMDRSRVGAAARAGGVDLVVVAGPAALVAALTGSGPVDLVLADLARPGVLDAVAALDGVAVVGFAAHVDGPTFDAARAAGVEALPRSVFFRRLGELLGADRS